MTTVLYVGLIALSVFGLVMMTGAFPAISASIAPPSNTTWVNHGFNSPEVKAYQYLSIGAILAPLVPLFVLILKVSRRPRNVKGD